MHGLMSSKINVPVGLNDLRHSQYKTLLSLVSQKLSSHERQPFLKPYTTSILRTIA